MSTEDQLHNESIKNEIISAINGGHIKMRPRWHFVLRGALAVVGGAIIGLLLLFLVSMIIFVLRQTGAGFAPAFGPRGWFIFFRSLPWLLIVFSLIFIALLELLARQYSFAYRRPLLYSAVGIIVLVVSGGFLVAGTSLHGHISKYVQDHHLPIGEGLYRGIRQAQFENIYPGIIVATTTDGLTLHGRRGDILTIIVTPETRIANEDRFMTNQPIVVFGERITSGTIRAFGIRLIDAD
jgi:hypothetical protein